MSAEQRRGHPLRPVGGCPRQDRRPERRHVPAQLRSGGRPATYQRPLDGCLDLTQPGLDVAVDRGNGATFSNAP